MEKFETTRTEHSPEELVHILKNDYSIDSVQAGGQTEMLLAMYGQELGDKTVEAIDFSGFENDQDFASLEDFLAENFGKNLGQRIFVKEINYQAEVVNFSLAGKEYYVPLEQFLSLQEKFPQLKEHRFRAESFSKWNMQLRFAQNKQALNTPIKFYAFLAQDLENKDYLADVPEQDKMKAYKLGTVAHEIAHHIYDYLFTEADLAAWDRLAREENFSTDYSGKYAEAKFENDEKFTEAVRLYTTVPQYLSSHFPQVFSFVKNKLDYFRKQD